MNIAIDVTPLETGHRNRGVGTYTKLLIEALEKYEKKHSYHFFTQHHFFSKSVLGKPKNVDLVHYPYFDPFLLSLPVIKSRPTIVTVHDLIPLVFTEHFPAGIRGRIKWQVQRLSLGRATRVITDSHASKQDIMAVADISSQTIDVVRLAPASVFRPVTDKALFQEVTTRYNLPQRFILYVGDINWNKNIVGLLKAFQKFKDATKNLQLCGIKLVLVGESFFQGSVEAREINECISAMNLDDEIVKIGGVPFEHLPALYSLASVYVQPSHYEGFGLPILEAMACGCPVISSHASSLVEIAGPAIMIDSNNLDDIANRMREALIMPTDKRQILIQKGILWAKRYSWELVAHQTVQSYEKAIAA